MRYHCIPSDVWIGPLHFESGTSRPLKQIVVFATPSPVFIAESVHSLEGVIEKRANSAENGLVWQCVVPFVNISGVVLWHLSASVQVSIVFRNQVYVMEEKTVKAVFCR